MREANMALLMDKVDISIYRATAIQEILDLLGVGKLTSVKVVENVDKGPGSYWIVQIEDNKGDIYFLPISYEGSLGQVRKDSVDGELLWVSMG